MKNPLRGDGIGEDSACPGQTSPWERHCRRETPAEPFCYPGRDREKGNKAASGKNGTVAREAEEKGNQLIRRIPV